MTRRSERKLKKSYKLYGSVGRKKTKVLSSLRAFMPEIIFRTTKLEGEPVTRKLVHALFR